MQLPWDHPPWAPYDASHLLPSIQIRSQGLTPSQGFPPSPPAGSLCLITARSPQGSPSGGGASGFTARLWQHPWYHLMCLAPQLTWDTCQTRQDLLIFVSLTRCTASGSLWTLNINSNEWLFFFSFFGCPTACGVPGPAIRTKLQSQQCQILNPMCQGGDWTCIPGLQRLLWSHCATTGTPNEERLQRCLWAFELVGL